MLALEDKDKYCELENIKNNYSTFGQLQIIAEQIHNLQIKATDILEQNRINSFLHNIKMDCKKIPGTIYYYYKIEGRDVLSIISPDEWYFRDNYIDKYLYNYDNIFYKIQDM